MNLAASSLSARLTASFALASVIFAIIIALAWHQPSRGVDLNAYLVGSTLLARGQDPYTTDEALWNKTVDEMSLGAAASRYRYPVHFALALEGVSSVAPTPLWVVLAMLNSLAALAAAVLIGLSVRGWQSVPLAVCLVGISATNVDTLLYGNVTGVMLLALAAGFYALQRASLKGFASVVPLGIALKVLPIVLLPVAVARRQYRLALCALIVTVMVFLVPLAFVGTASSLRFFRDIGEIATPTGFLSNNQSLLAAFVRMDWPRSVANAARCGILAVLGWMLVRCWMQPSAQRSSAAFAAILCAVVLVPTNVFYMYQLWLIFPLLFALDFFWQRRQRHLALWLLGVYVAYQVLSVLPEILHRILPAYFPPQVSLTDWLGSFPAIFCATLLSINAWIGLRREDATGSTAPRIMR